MHEMSVAQNIVEIVEQHLPDEPNVKVASVRIRIGELSGIVPDSLEFCFSAITTNTALDGARLSMEFVPIQIHCKSCHETTTLTTLIFMCTTCGNSDLEITGGNELQVVEIELEDTFTEET